MNKDDLAQSSMGYQMDGILRARTHVTHIRLKQTNF